MPPRRYTKTELTDFADEISAEDALGGGRGLHRASVLSRLKPLTMGMGQRRISWDRVTRAAREERPVSFPGSARHRYRAGGRAPDDYGLHGPRDPFVNRHIQRLRQQLAGRSSGRERSGGGHEHRIGEGARPGAKRRIEQSWETQYVVDAFSVGCHGRASCERCGGIDLRIRAGQRKDDLACPNALGLDQSLGTGGADDDVCVCQDFLQALALAAQVR